ncbi:AAEL010713-PA [Aedes aegypti]|uniref:AAEL010713-PA n=1 Tax=Aedes aegypti TaxID=7159 RepID=Q16S39_AEDAE|nr:AAEL010713-PA [Aedes aegypti]
MTHLMMEAVRSLPSGGAHDRSPSIDGGMQQEHLNGDAQRGCHYLPNHFLTTASVVPAGAVRSNGGNAILCGEPVHSVLFWEKTRTQL